MAHSSQHGTTPVLLQSIGMKFLVIPELGALSNCLHARIIGGLLYDARVELYSCTWNLVGAAAASCVSSGLPSIIINLHLSPHHVDRSVQANKQSPTESWSVGSCASTQRMRRATTVHL